MRQESANYFVQSGFGDFVARAFRIPEVPERKPRASLRAKRRRKAARARGR